MSLEHMNWRYVGAEAFSGTSVAAVLDALYALGIRATYNDGTTRTPGSGSAGTWTQIVRGQTECVYCTPATNTLNQRIMIGGTDATPTITMQTGETYSANMVMVNLVKNAGTSLPTGTTWNTSNPFGTGDVFGWAKWRPNTVGAGTVYLWEGRDAIAVLAVNSANTEAHAFIAGAIIDAESGNRTIDAETDGKIYGIVRTGSQRSLVNNFWTANYNQTSTFDSNSSRFLFTNSSDTNTVANNFAAVGAFVPGSATVRLLNSVHTFTTNPTGSSLKTASGSFARLPVLFYSLATGNIVGRFREVYAFADGQLGQRFVNGADIVGYIFSSSAATSADSLLLEHA